MENHIICRLEKLERENRRRKKIGLLAAVVASAFIVSGQAKSTKVVEANDSQASQTSTGTTNGVQVGQVLVTPLAVGTVSNSPLWGLKKPPKKGYHFVVVSLRVQNTSLYPNCTEWIPKILTDAGHKYGSQIFRAPDPPELERLPFHAETQGSYAFQVRDGEVPIGISLERTYEIERSCWNSKGFSPAEPFITTVNISLEGLPEPASPLQSPKPTPVK